MNRVYTDEQRKFFTDYVPGHTEIEIVKEFNRRFAADITIRKVRAYKKNNGLKSGTHKGTPKGESKVFPKEFTDFIIANNYGRTTTEITKLVNAEFKTDYKIKQIKAFRKNHKLVSGITGKFQKGNVPWTKGKKGLHFPGTEKTWFKKGQLPLNHKEIGTEVIDKNGYHKIKIAEPNKWKFKHIMEWEKHNGKIPAGCIIVFKDNNKDNVDISNLMMVTRAEHAIMNNKGLRFDNAELTEKGLLIAKLKHKTSELSREMKNAENSNS